MTKTPDTQRAVWRKRGVCSPKSLCEFASFSPVRALEKAPPVAKPPDVVGKFADAHQYEKSPKISIII
jgi:hypothetical protein